MYERILVPLDGSATADRGLEEAIALAKVHGSELVLLHVVDDYPWLMEASTVIAVEETRAAMIRYGEDLLERAQKKAVAASVKCQTRVSELKFGRVAEAIVEQAHIDRCHLIVMGTHGRRGFSRLTLGSDAELVVRTAYVPVLLIRVVPEGGSAS